MYEVDSGNPNGYQPMSMLADMSSFLASHCAMEEMKYNADFNARSIADHIALQNDILIRRGVSDLFGGRL